MNKRSLRPLSALILGAVLVIGPAIGASAVELGSDEPTMTREEFIEAVQQYAVITPEEAAEAWLDPEVRASLPVDSNMIVEESEPVPASTEQIARWTANNGDVARSAAPTAIAAMSSKTFSVSRNVVNVFGAELVRLSMTKTFLYDGVRAYHDAVTVTPTSNGALGYYFDGVTYSTDQYGSISGIPNSASISERHGKFGNVTGVDTRSIWLRAEGRYNGVTNSAGGE